MGVLDFFKLEEKPEIPVNLFSFDELVKKLDVNARTLIDLFEMKMIYLTVVTGKGLEFDKLREYNIGEDASSMDWNATARTTKPYVKVFQEERMLDVIIVVDVSNTMLLGTTQMLKNQYAALAAGVIALVGISSGDKVGGLLFSDKVKAFLEPSAMMDNYYALLSIMSRKKYYGGRKRWEVVPKTLLGTLGPDTVLFIISDFIGIDVGSFSEDISQFASQFKKVFGIMVRDPRDSYIPEGIGSVYLADPDTGEVCLVDLDRVRDEYNKKAAEQEEKISKVFKNTGQEFFKIYTNEEFIKSFTKYFELVSI